MDSESRRKMSKEEYEQDAIASSILMPTLVPATANANDLSRNQSKDTITKEQQQEAERSVLDTSGSVNMSMQTFNGLSNINVNTKENDNTDADADTSSNIYVNHNIIDDKGKMLVSPVNAKSQDKQTNDDTHNTNKEQDIDDPTSKLTMTPDVDLLSPPNLMRKVVNVQPYNDDNKNQYDNENNVQDDSVFNSNANDASTSLDHTSPSKEESNNKEDTFRHLIKRQYQDHSSATDDASGENDNNIPLSPIRKLSPLLSKLEKSDNQENDLSSQQGQAPIHQVDYSDNDQDINDTNMVKQENYSSLALKFKNDDRFNNNEIDNEDAMSVNSMVSEYGSDIGEIKLRIEDVHAMDAVAEENEEEDEEENEDDQDKEDNEIGKDDNNDENQGTSNKQTNVSLHLNESNISKAIQDEDDQSTNLNMDLESINLSASEVTNSFIDNRDHFVKLQTPLSKRHEFISDPQHNSSSPNTPIAAVSAAFRRLGTGVSQITRCQNINNNDDEKASSIYYEFASDHDFIRAKNDNNTKNLPQTEHTGKVWLSPRFGRRGEEFEDTSSFIDYSKTYGTTSPTNKRPIAPSEKATHILTSPLKHIRGCFTFDPENGTLPYGREHSSPPSSPFRTHRKSKSWGSNISAGKLSNQLKNFIGHDNNIYPEPFAQAQKINIDTNMSGPCTPSRENLQSRIIKSPKKRSQGNTVVLESPQRVRDFQREDALDILTLLVDQSIEFDQQTKQKGRLSKWSKLDNNNDNSHIDGSISSVDVEECIDFFHDLSEKSENKGPFSHHDRMKILNELELSYVYATEMKRAALSAMTWLRSLGRTSNDGCSVNDKNRPQFWINSHQNTNTSSSFEGQMEEKNNTIKRLNQELSICRAEIGRLTVLKRNENHFSSINKSILDEEADDDESSASSDIVVEDEFPNTSDIPISMNNSNIQEKKPPQNSIDEASLIGELRSEIEVLRAQLEKSNQAFENVDNAKMSMGVDDSRKDTKSSETVTSVDSNQNIGEREKEQSDEEEKNMVHVHMLDAENFVTEWNAFGPLPPPPDHDLHSPIVDEVLEQWTANKKTQDSLMSWLDNVLNGADVENVQPLQISSLNHQVRDGFSMHILPHLLRRSDILVEVTTRAHRQTTYDMAVSIKTCQGTSENSSTNDSENESLNLSKTFHSSSPHMMAYKVSGGKSMINTSQSNETKNVSKSAEMTMTTNQTQNESNKIPAIKAHQSSIVAGALNAVGGLLSRRKSQDTNTHISNDGLSRQYETNLPSPPHLTNTDQSFSSSDSIHDEEQPYHRVVSTPPGKIGVTFVQYRGHAMISDVYQDSPLLGWVFPSDILIAIDEIPVSGMRVPEIVRLLTARKDRQRALRLISSHAMSEMLITENSGALLDS